MTEIRTTSSTGGEKGVKLARFDLIPAGPLKELAEHYGRGARKYANHQWRQGYEWSKSIAALARHFNDFMAGKDYDVCSNDPTGCRHTDMDGEPFETGEPDTCFNHTGSHHMVAVAWHSFLLLEFKDTHQAHDDRYKGEPEPEPEFDATAIALEILADKGPFAPQIFPGDPDEPDLDNEARTEQPIQVIVDHPRPFPIDGPDLPPSPPASGAMARCHVEPVFNIQLNSVTPEDVGESVRAAILHERSRPRYRQGLLGGPARLTD